jgi:hypothetical protein
LGHDKKFAPRALAFDESGTLLAVAAGDAHIWDWRKGQLIRKVSHGGEVLSVSFGRNGLLATGGTDRFVRLTDRNAATVHELGHHGNAVLFVSFSSDGRRLVSTSIDQPTNIIVWDVELGEALKTLQHSNYTVFAAAFDPNRNRLASASEDGTVKIWDANSYREIQLLEGHTDSVTSLTYSPSGQRLATGSFDGTVRIWDTTRGTLQFSFPIETPVRRVMWENESYLLVGTSDGKLRTYIIDAAELQSYARRLLDSGRK